jgi:hypothetical protein
MRAFDGDDGWGNRFAVRVELHQELRDGETGAGIAEVRSDFSERNEDEGAFGEMGMREFEAGLTEDQVVVEKKIEVKGAGAVGNGSGTLAAKVALDTEESGEEFAGGERGLEEDDGVEKTGLIGETDRSGGVERGARRDAAARGKTRDGCGECRVGRAGRAGDVGAESDDRKRHECRLAELAG